MEALISCFCEHKTEREGGSYGRHWESSNRDGERERVKRLHKTDLGGAISFEDSLGCGPDTSRCGFITYSICGGEEIA